jgi:hypothetical protein
LHPANAQNKRGPHLCEPPCPLSGQILEFVNFFYDLIQRSRAEHGVSKDGRKTLRLWPSFETRASKSAVADFDTNGYRSRAGPTSVRAPQDEVVEKFHTPSG